MPIISKFLWGAAFANSVTFDFPLFDVVTDRVPREGSEWVQGASGAEDAWITGRDYQLDCVARWIPDNTGAGTPVSGTGGWQEFLDWARDKNPFRFVPNQATPLVYIDNVYLVEPMRGFGRLTPDLKREVPLRLRNATVDFHYALRGFP